MIEHEDELNGDELNTDEGELAEDQSEAVLDHKRYASQQALRALHDKMYCRGKGNNSLRPHWQLRRVKGPPEAPPQLEVVAVSNVGVKLIKGDLQWANHLNEALTFALCLYCAHSRSTWARKVRSFLCDFEGLLNHRIQLMTRLSILEPFPDLLSIGELGDDLSDFIDQSDKDRFLSIKFQSFFCDVVVPFLQLTPKSQISHTYQKTSEKQSLIDQLIHKGFKENKHITSDLKDTRILTPGGSYLSPIVFVGFTVPKNSLQHELSTRILESKIIVADDEVKVSNEPEKILPFIHRSHSMSDKVFKKHLKELKKKV